MMNDELVLSVKCQVLGVRLPKSTVRFFYFFRKTAWVGANNHSPLLKTPDEHYH